MEKISENGLWEVFIPQIKQYDMYKYSIEKHRQATFC